MTESAKTQPDQNVITADTNNGWDPKFQEWLASRIQASIEGRLEGRQQGRIDEARRLLLMLGRKRFGPATPDVECWIDQKVDRAELEELLCEKYLHVSSWDELLATVD